MLNYLRNSLFWVADSLKGGKLKKHLREVTSILSNPNSPNSKLVRQQNLKNLLKHATDTTSFYKSFKDVYDLDMFPVIKKTIIQENFEKFQSKPYIGKSNFKVSTSGSTGVPFFLFQDDGKRYRNRADVLYFLKQCHFEVGNRLYELEVWRGHNQKGALKSWTQNVAQFDVSRLTDSRIVHLIDTLKNDKQTKTLLGFASAYELICQYMERSDIHLSAMNISAIIANSEYLNEYTKTTMRTYFDAPVLSRYSSEEIGIIAHQTIASTKHFVVNHASYNIEILNLETDTPAKPGDFGRIVVTDLFNYCMPIIRYDTGDIAKLIEDENGVRKFEQIEGRKMDLIYDTQGNIISSFVVYTKFYNYYKLLKQYQFIQQGEKEYVVKLNIRDKFPFENELIENIKNDFGSDAKVSIDYVDEIPALSSGKRKKVVNTFHNN